MKNHTLLYLPLVAVIAAAAGFVGGRDAGGPLAISTPEDTMYDGPGPGGWSGATARPDPSALRPGDVLLLEPGRHAPLDLDGLRGTADAPVIVEAQDPDRPTVVTGISLRDAAHVMLKGLVVQPPAGAPGVVVAGARDIEMTALSLSGAVAEGVAGLSVERSVGVTFERGSIQGFATSVRATGTDGLTLRRSHFSGMGGASVDVGAGEWLALEHLRIEAAAPGTADGPALRLGGPEGLSDASVIGLEVTGTDARPARIAVEGPVSDMTFERNHLLHAAADAITFEAVDGLLLKDNRLNGAQGRARIALPEDASGVVRAGNLAAAGASPAAEAKPLDPALGRRDVADGTVGTGRGTAFAGLAGVAHVPRPLDLREREVVVPGSAVFGERYATDRIVTRDVGARPEVLPLRLRYDGRAGEAESFDAEGRVEELISLGVGSGRIDAEFEGFEFPDRMLDGFFDSIAFELRVRVRAVPDRTAWGQFARIHLTLEAGVNRDGELQVWFQTAEAPKVGLTLKGTDLLDGAWHDVVIAYDGTRETLTAKVGEEERSVRTWGHIRPAEFWSLFVGNPFGDRKELDGEVGLIELTAFGPN